MRKNTVVSVTLATVVLIALSAAGQQLVIDLPVEPRREAVALTLADAVAANNYPAFVALYRDAADARLYGDIHELWQYSMTDPIGAFYGAEMYERFARRYPGYEAFIADYGVVDSRGDTYYPSAETRAFLLAQIGTAIAVPEQKPLVAEVKVEAPVASPAPSVPAAESVALPSVPPVVVAVAPPPPAAEDSRAPSIAPAPAPPVRVASRVAPVSRPDATRGILLTILGLAGIGMLSLMLQTPSEDEHADHVA